MNFMRIYLADLVAGVLERHIPLVDSLTSLLSPDPVQGSKSIIRLTQATLLEFESYLPMCRTFELDMTEESFTFVNNYEDWIKNGGFLNQIPLTVVSAGKGTYTLTSNYWNFKSGVFRSAPGFYTLRTFCNYPYKLELTPSGLINPESHIYGFDNAVLQQFQNLFDLKILKAIKVRSKLVNLPFTVDFLNLDESIADLKDEVDSDKVSAASLMYRWD